MDLLTTILNGYGGHNSSRDRSQKKKKRERERLHSVDTALKGPEMPCKFPGVWAKDSPPGLAITIPPVVIEIKPRVAPIKMKQYPVPMRTQKEISYHLQRL
jgi:hypothetical protein